MRVGVLALVALGLHPCLTVLVVFGGVDFLFGEGGLLGLGRGLGGGFLLGFLLRLHLGLFLALLLSLLELAIIMSC